MATPIRMPDIGTVEGEVLLVRWLKAEGEAVAFGEPLLEVETDKGVNEVESIAAGVLLKRLAVEGTKVGAGELIAWIGAPGEAVPGAAGGPAPTSGSGASGPAVQERIATGPTARKRIPPSLSLLPKKRGVDLAAVSGTGPGGAVTREDILRARTGTAAAGAPVHAAAAAPSRPGAPARTRLSGGQAVVAKRVAKSWAEKPAYHVSMQVDMSRVQAFRADNPVSYDAILVRAVGVAVAEFPVFRSHLEGVEIVEAPDIAVAVSVSVGEDLYAPVLRSANTRSVSVLSREIEELAAKARSRSLAPAEVEGGCILVSNLGMLPVESFDAIIYPDHSAALAVGAALPTPVAAGREVRLAPLARLTLSVDHRLINGKTAAQFLARVKEILEAGAFA